MKKQGKRKKKSQEAMGRPEDLMAWRTDFLLLLASSGLWTLTTHFYCLTMSWALPYDGEFTRGEHHFRERSEDPQEEALCFHEVPLWA